MFPSTLRLSTGTIESVSPMQDCFSYLITLRTANGMVTFILSSETDVIGCAALTRGMRIGAFYDYQRPTTLQYPPTYQAVVIAPLTHNEQVMINYFDMSLMASDQSLGLNIDSSTKITTTNGQRFVCNPGGHVLLIYYSATTRSIPPKTTPHKIVVLN